MDTIYNFILQEALRGGHETEERVWNAFKEFPLLWMPQKKDWPDFKIPNLTVSPWPLKHSVVLCATAI
eukprot:379174-Pelagomonas_calceolata.AAC.3